MTLQEQIRHSIEVITKKAKEATTDYNKFSEYGAKNEALGRLSALADALVELSNIEINLNRNEKN